MFGLGYARGSRQAILQTRRRGERLATALSSVHTAASAAAAASGVSKMQRIVLIDTLTSVSCALQGLDEC